MPTKPMFDPGTISLPPSRWLVARALATLLLLSCGSSGASGPNTPGSGGSAGSGSGGASGGSNASGGTSGGAGGAGGSSGSNSGGVSGSGGSGSPAPKPCSTDAACKVQSDTCTGCDCRATLAGESLPVCPGPGGRCFADPCMNKKAACQKGRCVVVDALPSVRHGRPAYDPCTGKKCGDLCHICPPDDPTCLETAQVKQCNAAGKCAIEAPICPGH